MGEKLRGKFNKNRKRGEKEKGELKWNNLKEFGKLNSKYEALGD